MVEQELRNYSVIIMNQTSTTTIDRLLRRTLVRFDRLSSLCKRLQILHNVLVQPIFVILICDNWM
jgi:hypothetical protein